MAKKRLFISIELPKDLKRKIAAEIEKIRFQFTNDIRFLEPENWHITLVFLGYQPEELLDDIITAIQETAPNFSAPQIEFTGLSYGPLGKTPRMVWLNGSPQTSQTLSALKNSLETALLDRGVNFKQEHRGFKAHITLARFPQVSTQELPQIEQKLNWQFAAKSIDLMESRLTKSGANYEKIAGAYFNAQFS